jgi:hypothetical protein
MRSGVQVIETNPDADTQGGEVVTHDGAIYWHDRTGNWTKLELCPSCEAAGSGKDCWCCGARLG